MAISSNQGDSWQATLLGRSFESSPYVENAGGQLRKYSLELPYPQHRQDEFLCGGDTDVLTAYQRFIDSELDPNGFPVRHCGPDRIEGSFRTNADLWIRQAGGGTNNGWPTFNGLTITSGQVKVYPGGGTDFPMETVFPGGLIENAPPVDGSGTEYYRQNAIQIGPNYSDGRHIIYVDVSGTTADIRMGIKLTSEDVQYGVYPVYPANNLGNPLFTNTVTYVDTVWVSLSCPNLANQTFFTHHELWIKGIFATHQTWVSASDIKIIGDILLAETLPGEDPINNTNDSVSLISEKKIEVKYGYLSPVDGLRYHVCRASSDPIKVYASLIALCEDDSRFTFEYQHPHPSVPAVNIYGSNWDNIDLHRYQYPQATPNGWYLAAAQIDYPWYNPLWPEARPYLERGTLQTWGSIYERTRGFLHRSYVDQDRPNPTGIWDIENDLCGGSSAPNITSHTDPVLGIQLGTMNYPGTTGSGIGYQRDQHHDLRRTFADDYSFRFGIVLDEIDPTGDGMKNDDILHYTRVPHAVRSKVIARNGDAALYAVNSNIAFENGAHIENIYPFGDEDTAIIEQMDWVDDQRVLIVRHDASNPEPYSLHILNPYTLDVVDVPAGLFGNQQTEYPELLCDILPSVDGHGRFALYPLVPWVGCQNSLEIYNIDLNNGEYALHRSGTLSWDYSCDLTNQHQLEVKNVTDNQCDVILNIQQNGNDTYTSIRYATIQMSNTSNMDDHMVPAAKPSVSVYPNPSRADFSITVKNLAQGEVKAEVFNIRGQKVAEIKDFSPASDTGLNSRWQALDANQQRLAAGVYLMRIKQQGKVIATKRITVF